SGRALHFDVAAHEAAELLRDRESQARAAVLFHRSGVGLDESAEEALALLRGHADPGVRDAEEHPVALRPHVAPDVERDGAVLGELAGVREQVQQNLTPLRDVLADRPDVLRAVDFEAVARFLAPR